MCANAKHQNDIAKKIEKEIRELTRSLGIKSIASMDKNTIRNHARSILKKKGVEPKCEVCGFSDAVEVHHIIPISAFPKQATLSLVNNEFNLVYLCPNHHTMVHKEIISAEDLRKLVSRLNWFH